MDFRQLAKPAHLAGPKARHAITRKTGEMAKKDYSEDLLIQAPTAELLEQQLGWESVFAQDEGAKGGLGQIVCWGVHRCGSCAHPRCTAALSA